LTFQNLHPHLNHPSHCKAKTYAYNGVIKILLTQKSKPMKKTLFMFGVATCLLTVSCSDRQSTGPEVVKLPNDVILQWDEVAYQAFGGEAYLHSLMASRINAMTHIAMHDALNAIHPVYSTYFFMGKDPEANPIAAAASAAHAVLKNEIPESIQFLDSALYNTLSTIVEDEAKTRGIQLGKAAARPLLTCVQMMVPMEIP
jgi:hypothetical protein